MSNQFACHFCFGYKSSGPCEHCDATGKVPYCHNCDGRHCMDCVLRYVHDKCEKSCPDCCENGKVVKESDFDGYGFALGYEVAKASEAK